MVKCKKSYSDRPLLLKVIKLGTRWAVKSSRVIDGWTLDDGKKTKADAIRAAFRYAKQFSPAKVRLYSADGKFQVESIW